MTGDFEQIESIRSLANGLIGNELYFTYPEALKVVDICRNQAIAVLGVEIFQIRLEGFQAKGCSEYQVPPQDWPTFVEKNNALGERVLRENAAGDDHVYVLTTASKDEFRRLSQFGRS